MVVGEVVKVGDVEEVVKVGKVVDYLMTQIIKHYQ
jgi:hypothetical protein